MPFARPYQWNLDWYFSRADRIRLYTGGASGGRTVKGSVFLCEVTPPATRTIHEALRLETLKASPRCLCCGSIAIELWEGERLLTTLALHHNKTLRVPGGWPLDGVLRDGPALARWLAAQGHPAELESHYADLRREQELDQDKKAFYRDAPPRLRDLAKSSVPLSTLRSRYPDSLELCQDLLRLFGVARRRWEPGLLLPECNVADALKEIGLDTLVEATSQSHGEEKILRGAARYWTNRVKQADQFRLPDSQWQLLTADQNNSKMLVQTVDRIRRKRLRQAPGASHSLASPTIVAAGGPYSNLVSQSELVYALCGTRIVEIPSGDTIFDSKHSDVTFCKNLPFHIALPSEGKVLQVAERGARIWDTAQSLNQPQVIPTTHSFLSAWTDGEYRIQGPLGTLLNSPVPIRRAWLSEKWLFWSTDAQVLRLQLEPPNSLPEVLHERKCCLLSSMDDQLVSVYADGSIWLDRQQIGQATHQPLALAADENSIYLLTQQADGNWALEHPRDGILAEGLTPSERPSITLTTSHLFGAVGQDIMAFERVP